MADERVRMLLESMKSVGIREGDTVLDFCCGEGSYTIPAAIVAGEEGKVYALDRSREKLDTLKKTIQEINITNIEIMEYEFISTIPLPENSIDVVLLYDIFWYFHLGDDRLPDLLEETRRLLKPDGLVSVYPEHIDERRLCEVIKSKNYILRDKAELKILHEGCFKKDCIYNYMPEHVNHP